MSEEFYMKGKEVGLGSSDGKFNTVYLPIETWKDIEKKLRALEIIKESPIFAWYVTIYKDAYEMVADVKGFRTNNSVEELQEMFDLLKEVLL